MTFFNLENVEHIIYNENSKLVQFHTPECLNPPPKTKSLAKTSTNPHPNLHPQEGAPLLVNVMFHPGKPYLHHPTCCNMVLFTGKGPIILAALSYRTNLGIFREKTDFPSFATFWGPGSCDVAIIWSDYCDHLFIGKKKHVYPPEI